MKQLLINTPVYKLNFNALFNTFKVSTHYISEVSLREGKCWYQLKKLFMTTEDNERLASSVVPTDRNTYYLDPSGQGLTLGNIPHQVPIAYYLSVDDAINATEKQLQARLQALAELKQKLTKEDVENV